MKQVSIYTDGACSGNPGPGGWGAVLLYGQHKKEISGGEPSTTNNRMELTAVIAALSMLKEPCAVDLYSDSKYVIDALEKGWARGWKKRGWVKSDKKPVGAAYADGLFRKKKNGGFGFSFAGGNDRRWSGPAAGPRRGYFPAGRG